VVYAAAMLLVFLVSMYTINIYIIASFPTDITVKEVGHEHWHSCMHLKSSGANVNFRFHSLLLLFEKINKRACDNRNCPALRHLLALS
jgi:hypothetical protein